SERPAVFDTAGVCRLGEPQDHCSCILQASYDPRRFLEYDVQPCLGYSPEQPHNLQKARWSRNQFERAIEHPPIAFVMGASMESVPIWDLSSGTYDRILASRSCLPLYGVFRVCFTDPAHSGTAQVDR